MTIDQTIDHAVALGKQGRLNSQPDQYTWWSNRGDAWNKNVGWRIDYHVATPALAKAAKKESIYKTRRFSDHAPLTIDYDWQLS